MSHRHHPPARPTQRPLAAGLPPELGIQAPDAQGVHYGVQPGLVVMTAFFQGRFLQIPLTPDQAISIGVNGIQAGTAAAILAQQAQAARTKALAEIEGAVDHRNDDLLAQSIAATNGKPE